MKGKRERGRRDGWRVTGREEEEGVCQLNMWRRSRLCLMPPFNRRDTFSLPFIHFLLLADPQRRHRLRFLFSTCQHLLPQQPGRFSPPL